MYEQRGRETLRSGETLEIGVVTAPDAPLATRIDDLLSHKGPEWRGHVQAALRGETDRLETRFYLGLLGGEPAGNIMTVEQRGVGILGHVFTRPEHRRKGICRAIMERQMAHFRERGGQVLLLGTGFESPPYWIYHSFGFRSLRGGFMRYAVSEGDAFEREWFAPAPATIAPAEWRHWPLVALLTSAPGKEYLRSAAWSLLGIGNAESPYARFMMGRASGTDGVVLETASGAVVGCATLHPARLGLFDWPAAWLADVFTHPVFADRSADLLGALTPPPGRLIGLVDTEAAEKAAAYEAAGFAREGTLTRFLRAEEGPRDVWLYARESA